MTRARGSLVLACCAGLLVASCSPSELQKAKDAQAAVNERINAYCDRRAELLDSLRGEAGAP